MDIKDVKAKVDSHISADHVLTLRYQGNGLNSTPIDSVIHTYFADTLTGLVQLVNGQTGVIDENNQLVIYSLSLTVKDFSLYKNATPVAAQLTFSIKNDVIQLGIKATLPKSYSLADSFSELKDKKTLPINQVELENCIITLQSDATPVSQFTAGLLPAGPLKTIDWLLKKKTTVSGSIDFETHGGQQFPSINLATPNLDPFKFGIFELDLIVRLRSVVKSFPNHHPAFVFLTHVELLTEFKTQALTLPVVMPLHGKGDYLLSFYLDLDKPRPPINSLNALTGFTGGSDPKQFLNPELDLGKAKLALDSLSVVVDPYAMHLVNFEIGISLELDWTIITDKLELEKIGAVFTIEDPAHPKAENITAFLFAQLKVGPVGLDASVTLPDKTFQAQLAAGSEIDINEVLKTFSPGLKLPGNDTLTVQQLDVMAHAKKGEESFSVEAGAHGHITIIDGLDFDNIYLFLEYQSKAISSVNLNTTFRLTSIAVDINLLADFDQEQGWQFEGGNGPGQAIPIGHLIDDMSRMFGAVSVPEVIKDLSIKDLKTTFNSKSKDFHFNVETDFGKDASVVVTFANLHQLDTQPPVFEKRATGVLKVFPGKPNELEFDLGLDLKPDSKHFVALYNNPGQQALNIADLVKAMFPEVDSNSLPSFNITIKDVLAGYVSTKEDSHSVFAIDIGASLDLSSLGDIPLIGKLLSAAKTLKLAFQFLYPAKKPALKADLTALNSLIGVAGPRFPTDADITALKIKTELRIGDGQPIDFNLPVTVSSSGQIQSQGSGFAPPPGAQPTDDGVNWFQLNKKFGPVQLQRAGFKFENGEITALLEGGLTALGLEVDLMGLSVKSKITDVQNGNFKPVFGLQGLGLSFSKGGVSFAGALLRFQVTRDNKQVEEYAGLATVQAEGIRLAAIGSLTEVNNQTALFLYAVLDYPLGGTPFFYVTGLAGGFGLNQKLTMPKVDQVASFPLIAAAMSPPTMPTDPGSAGPFITQQIKSIETYLTPNVGQYFGCAGVRFTSFELLDSFVLVSISFGREFELDLLGISTLVVPPELPEGEPPLAKVSLQIVASFIPDQGIAIVQGSLTADSYILDPACHLTGGFAFATWFGTNPHAGDFVITLGGYHPDFQKPDHYPTVPRVGINWQITPQLSVTGGLYFALTPRALMAGGAMRAVFQTSLDLGIATVDVKAWFILGADFIVYWKPFHYSAHLYVDIGIDVVIHFLGTHDIGFDAGADLQVWGPPFGGHAHISFKIIGITVGFDVSFGASAPKPLPLDWDNDDPAKSFRKSFLPKKDGEIVSVAISDGLVRKVDRSANQARAVGDEKSDTWYVINPKDFCVRTSSVIPIKDCSTSMQWDKNQHNPPLPNNDFGIASMNKGSGAVKTFHQITVTPDVQSQFVVRPIVSHVPGGLWATSNSDDINAELLIENALIGVEIVPGLPSVAGGSRNIERKALSYTTYKMTKAYADNGISGFTATSDPGDDPAKNRQLWQQIQGEINKNTTRDAMLAAMGFAASDLDIGEPFTSYAAYAPSYGHL